MEKTALQQVIKEIENHIVLSAHNKLGTNRTGDYRIGLNKALDFIRDALPTERQQIIDSFIAGVEFIPESSRRVDISDAEKYFNETYKKNNL